MGIGAPRWLRILSLKYLPRHIVAGYGGVFLPVIRWRSEGGSLRAGIPLGPFPPTYQPMTIVTAKPPKRQPRPKPSPTTPIGPAIVTPQNRRARLLDELPEDPEADARVKAWFARNVRPVGS